jgi:hypothetical protein
MVGLLLTKPLLAAHRQEILLRFELSNLTSSLFKSPQLQPLFIPPASPPPIFSHQQKQPRFSRQKSAIK